jgi:hypothetical protein
MLTTRAREAAAAGLTLGTFERVGDALSGPGFPRRRTLWRRHWTTYRVVPSAPQGAPFIQ